MNTMQKNASNMSSRLAIVTPVFPPYHGGMGSVAARHAALFAQRGYDVSVYTPQYDGKSTDAQRDGYTIHWCSPTFAYGNAGHIDLQQAFTDNDIVHLHFPFYFSAEQCMRLRKQFPEKRFFITYHMDPIGTGLKGLFFWLYARVMTPRVLPCADAIFVSTREYAEAGSNGAYFRAHADRVVEAPFGVDFERFYSEQPNRDTLRLQNRLDEHLPIILFVGGMDTPHYFKGIPVLLEAFEKCQERAQLVLVGDGDRRSHYEALARKSAKSNVIHFVGSADADTLPHWYRAAALFVLPSINRGEAFGLVLLEAMASGTVAIASDLPGVASVLAHGKAGELFPAGDSTALAQKIDRLLANPNYHKQLSASGHAHAQLYTWSRMADLYASWYTSS